MELLLREKHEKHFWDWIIQLFKIIYCKFSWIFFWECSAQLFCCSVAPAHGERKVSVSLYTYLYTNQNYKKVVKYVKSYQMWVCNENDFSAGVMFKVLLGCTAAALFFGLQSLPHIHSWYLFLLLHTKKYPTWNIQFIKKIHIIFSLKLTIFSSKINNFCIFWYFLIVIRLPSLSIGYLVLTRRHLRRLFSIIIIILVIIIITIFVIIIIIILIIIIRLPSLVIGYLVLTRRHLHSLFSISTAIAHIVTGLYLYL